MKRMSGTEEQQQTCSEALAEIENREVNTVSKLKRAKNRHNVPMTSTSDSDENQPQLKRQKPKKKPRGNETQVIETTTSSQIIQPPSIEYETSQSSKFTLPSVNTGLIEQNFDIEIIKKRHKELHATEFKEHVIESAIEFEKSINPDTSCGSSLSSPETSSHSERSKGGEHSNQTAASNQREPSSSLPVDQIDHGNVTSDPEVPIQAVKPLYRAISVEDFVYESTSEVEDTRKRTISVEDGEIEITEIITNAQRQQEILTVDLSSDDEEEEEDENNVVVVENVAVKSLQPVAAEKEPPQIDDNETALVLMPEKPSNSFRRHKYKKTPHRMSAVQDIKRLQRSVTLLIPKLPFQRLVREIMEDQKKGAFHIQGNALAALHEAAEMQMIELFEETVLLCSHRDRATIGLKDIHLACKLQEHYESKRRLG